VLVFWSRTARESLEQNSPSRIFVYVCVDYIVAWRTNVLCSMRCVVFFLLCLPQLDGVTLAVIVYAHATRRERSRVSRVRAF